MNLTDEELYDRFLNRHTQDDFRVLFEKYKEGLLLFLNGFVHNLDDAEELMIDAFAEVAAGRTIFSRRSSFKTWLFSIGKKLALMHLRKAKRTETVLYEITPAAAGHMSGNTYIPDVAGPARSEERRVGKECL